MRILRPITERLRSLIGLRSEDLRNAAHDQWQIAPPERRAVPPVLIPKGHAERIVHTEFASAQMVLSSLTGDPAEQIGATMGYALRDVDIIDGVAYSRGIRLHLHQHHRRSPFPKDMTDAGKGALYETWVGNRWFGNWLLDDCLSYSLAEDAGGPVTTKPQRPGHVTEYEALLDMHPRRIGDVHFDELIVFDDHANNSNRIGRAARFRRKLTQAASGTPAPGVFLMRGRSGDLRNLANEEQIAAYLAEKHGFKVLWPERHTAGELAAACAGVKVAAGVEGSQLCHAIGAMPPGATVLTLQPPDRVTTVLKLMTDRWMQRLAVVVGIGVAASFQVDPADVAEIMNLILTDPPRDPS